MRFLLLNILFLGSTVCAQNLKPDFGQGGKISLDIDDLDNLVGLLSDGLDTTYFYGNTSEDLGGVYPTDVFFGKLDAYGNLDSDFGNSGIARFDFPGFENSTVVKAVYHSSGIYFIGEGNNSMALDTVALFIGKIDLNGNLDVNFGSNGFFNSQFLGTYNTAGSILIDEEEKIVFCGSTTDDQNTFVEFPLLGRLSLNGVPDSSLGNTGLIAYDYYNGTIVDAMEVPIHHERHGDGAYIYEIAEIGDNYFLAGKYVGTSYSMLYMMSINKNGLMNPDFVSSGPQTFQIDPGHNHYLKDLAYDGEHVYLAVSTQGVYNNNLIIQKIDTNGIIGPYLTIDHANYLHRTEFLTAHENSLYLGGYYLNQSNVGPGYHSDKVRFYQLSKDLMVDSSFHFEEDLSTTDELGGQAIVFHDLFGLTGGYMNNLSGSNYTDLFFVAFEMETSQTAENQFTFTVYPNPTHSSLRSDFCFGEYTILNLSGQKISQGKAENEIDISQLESGTYILELSQYSSSIRFVKR